MVPEVEAFESEFAAAAGAAHAVGTGTGTDALALILRALDIGAGDEVITTPLSAAYTALAIMMAGARPVFADIDADRLTIDAAEIERAVTLARGPSCRCTCMASLPTWRPSRASLHVTTWRSSRTAARRIWRPAAGRQVGTIGIAGAFSFYPTKNLGALGDGGAVVTNDRALAERIRRLRNGGQTERYVHEEAGVNSRLDEMQAAVLRARLPFLPRWTARRRLLASLYRTALSTGADAAVTVPPEYDAGHVYHLFPVRSARRDELQAHLKSRGIETLVHYPVPIPSQPALAGSHPAACPRTTRRLVKELVSLPLHPALTEAAVADVAAAVRDCGRKD